MKRTLAVIGTCLGLSACVVGDGYGYYDDYDYSGYSNRPYGAAAANYYHSDYYGYDRPYVNNYYRTDRYYDDRDYRRHRWNDERRANRRDGDRRANNRWDDDRRSASRPNPNRPSAQSPFPRSKTSWGDRSSSRQMPLSEGTAGRSRADSR